MASSSSDDPGLGEEDLSELYESIYPARSKCKAFGIHIGLPLNEIKEIEAKESDHGDRLLEILSARFKKAKPLMWNDIEKALKSQSVNEIKLANKVTKKYGHLFPSSFEQQKSQVSSGKDMPKGIRPGKQRIRDDQYSLHKEREKYSDEEGVVDESKQISRKSFSTEVSSEEECVVTEFEKVSVKSSQKEYIKPINKRKKEGEIVMKITEVKGEFSKPKQRKHGGKGAAQNLEVASNSESHRKRKKKKSKKSAQALVYGSESTKNESADEENIPHIKGKCRSEKSETISIHCRQKKDDEKYKKDASKWIIKYSSPDDEYSDEEVKLKPSHYSQISGEELESGNTSSANNSEGEEVSYGEAKRTKKYVTSSPEQKRIRHYRAEVKEELRKEAPSYRSKQSEEGKDDEKYLKDQKGVSKWGNKYYASPDDEYSEEEVKLKPSHNSQISGEELESGNTSSANNIESEEVSYGEAKRTKQFVTSHPEQKRIRHYGVEDVRVPQMEQVSFYRSKGRNVKGAVKEPEREKGRDILKTGKLDYSSTLEGSYIPKSQLVEDKEEKSETKNGTYDNGDSQRLINIRYIHVAKEEKAIKSVKNNSERKTTTKRSKSVRSGKEVNKHTNENEQTKQREKKQTHKEEHRIKYRTGAEEKSQKAKQEAKHLPSASACRQTREIQKEKTKKVTGKVKLRRYSTTEISKGASAIKQDIGDDRKLDRSGDLASYESKSDNTSTEEKFNKKHRPAIGTELEVEDGGKKVKGKCKSEQKEQKQYLKCKEQKKSSRKEYQVNDENLGKEETSQQTKVKLMKYLHPTTSSASQRENEGKKVVYDSDESNSIIDSSGNDGSDNSEEYYKDEDQDKDESRKKEEYPKSKPVTIPHPAISSVSEQVRKLTKGGKLGSDASEIKTEEEMSGSDEEDGSSDSYETESNNSSTKEEFNQKQTISARTKWGAETRSCNIELVEYAKEKLHTKLREIKCCNIKSYHQSESETSSKEIRQQKEVELAMSSQTKGISETLKQTEISKTKERRVKVKVEDVETVEPKSGAAAKQLHENDLEKAKNQSEEGSVLDDETGEENDGDSYQMSSDGEECDAESLSSASNKEVMGELVKHEKENQKSDKRNTRKTTAVEIHKDRKKSRKERQINSKFSSGEVSSSPPNSQEEREKFRYREQRKVKKQNRNELEEENMGRQAGREVFDTDDSPSSSPEYDRLKNISETEANNIRNVFETFYGKLCSKIVDPVAIAAELQKKGVISKFKMKEIMISPESQQSKTIHLVDELDNGLQSHSGIIFDVIDVLLETESLENIGRDLLRETGTMCPEIIAERFSHQMAIDDRVSLTHEGTQQGVPTTESKATPIPTSHEVSQSIPISGSSPNMTKYKCYLQACYNARALAPADKYLPTLQAPYINLAMVHREYAAPEERDEFIRQTLHGGVDEIIKRKVPIKFEDLFSPVKSKGRELENEATARKSKGKKLRPPRFILVEGPPGIGKSTFSWEVCRRWDDIMNLRYYLILLLLKLREKWVLNATSLADLFRYEYDSELSKLIAKELAETQGEGLLLILDGFDEVSHCFHQNSIIKSILCRQLLPACTIILTTRPSAMHALKEICQPEVDKHIEIVGFTEEERVKYMTEVFSSEPQLQANFLKYMFLIPHIKSMMYIPLNCAIIAQVYYESQSSQCLAIPKTRTQLYGALTNSLLVRHMKTTDSSIEYDSILPEGLNEKDMERFTVLAKFAFDSYHQKGSSRKVTFFKEDIPEGLVHFGFMNESCEMYARKGVEKIFSFLHLSLQEYLAAMHVAHSYSIEFQMAYHELAVNANNYEDNMTYEGSNAADESLIKSLNNHGSALIEPAVFLAGITGLKNLSSSDSNRWQTYLSHVTVIMNDQKCILLRSLYEAQNHFLGSYYFDSTDRIIEFCREYPDNQDLYEDLSEVINFTPYDCYALSYCLANSSGIFTLRLCFKRELQLVETFIRGLDDHVKSTPPVIKRLELGLRNGYSEECEKCLKWLSKTNCWEETEELQFQYDHLPNINLVIMFFQSMPNVKKFETGPNPIDIDILPVLNSLTILEVLHITLPHEGNFPPSGLDWLLVKPNLKEINLDTVNFLDPNKDNIQITNPMIQSLLKAFLQPNEISKLCLSNTCHDAVGGVRNILLHCPSLVSLELKKARLGYDGILFICSALRYNNTLEHLVIHDHYQPTEDIILKSQELLPSVNRGSLPDNVTSTDLILELANILKHNNTIREIYLQYSTYYYRLQYNTYYYLRAFSFVLRNNTTEIVVSNVSRDTMTSVRNVLLHCPSLVSLELQETRLGYDGILFICSALRYNQTLKRLMIHDQSELTDGTKLISMSRCDLLPPLPPQTGTSSLPHCIQPAPPPLDLRYRERSTKNMISSCTCTDFLLELNKILRSNNTLNEIDIQSGLFRPLPSDYWIYDGEDLPLTFVTGNGSQWTGLGPLQQFDVGAVASGRSPNLRRSFSSSDLISEVQSTSIERRDLQSLLSSLHKLSFTAPDTEVLQPFSGLDRRLQNCLKIFSICWHLKWLQTYYDRELTFLHNARNISDEREEDTFRSTTNI